MVGGWGYNPKDPVVRRWFVFSNTSSEHLEKVRQMPTCSMAGFGEFTGKKAGSPTKRGWFLSGKPHHGKGSRAQGFEAHLSHPTAGDGRPRWACLSPFWPQATTAVDPKETKAEAEKVSTI